MSGQVFTLKELAVELLDYFDIPSADADIAANGNSYARYVKAQRCANLAAQELADYGPWPWLTRNFVSVTLASGAHQALLPDDVHRLLTDVSYEDYSALFEPAALQQFQQLRATSTGTGTPRVCALSYEHTVDDWAAETVTAIGDLVQPSTGETGFWYECTVRAGDFLTGASEPTWGTTLDGTTDDDTNVTWTCRQAGRHELIVWPPADEAKTLTVAYTRLLPEMTNGTDVPRVPANLHRIILTGTLATGEEVMERNWGGGARARFEMQMSEAWRKGTQSAAMTMPLRAHRHTLELDHPYGPSSDTDVTHPSGA